MSKETETEEGGPGTSVTEPGMGPGGDQIIRAKARSFKQHP